MPGRFDPNDYIDVQDRIVKFWVEYPDGAIRTKLESLPDDFDTCRYAARIFKHRDSLEPDATGWAFERAGGGGANSTSHEENCETSCVGRALANMGYATSRQDRPSRQEMEKVSRHQPEPELPPQARTTLKVNMPPTTQTTTNPADSRVTSWTEFWAAIEAMGLPRDKKALESLISSALGADPAYALERVQAWAHDTTTQPSLTA